MSVAEPPRDFRGLPTGARVLIAGAVAAAVAAVYGAGSSNQPEADLVVLAVLVLACAAGNLFEVFAPGHFSLQPNIVPFVCGVVILPAWAIPVLALAAFAAGWAVRRPPWFMPVFNIANYALAGALMHLVVNLGGGLDGSGERVLGALALMGGAGLFVAVNHALIGVIVDLAAARPLRTVLANAARLRATAGGRLIDLALAVTGACLAGLWWQAPGYAPLAAGPALLIGLAVWVPMLRHESRIDSKTGLFNSRHLLRLLEGQVDLARRRETSLAVVMVDLDYMRAINNRFGHLEGDKLIREVAEVLERLTSGSAVASRFGGEEFCLVVPGATAEEARQLAESVRAGVRAIRVGDDLAPSASVGVAMYPEHGVTAEELMHAADLALYDAKLGGRNRVRVALPPATRAMLALHQDDDMLRARHDVDAEAMPEPAWQAQLDVAPAIADQETAPPAPEPEVEDAPSRRWIRPFALLLCLLAGGVGLLAERAAFADRPGLLAMLIVMVVLLDFFRLDLFERVQISLASMPVLALASVFGPLGPIAAEGAIVLVRALRRVPPVKFCFDFGALSLAGAAAAGAFAAGPETGAAAIAVGVVAGLVYYLVNTSLLAVVIGLSRGSSPIANWREQLAWLAPHYASYGLLAAAFVLAERRFGYVVGLVYTVPIVVLWVAERQYVERSRAGVQAVRAKNLDLERANERLRALLSDNDDLLRRIHNSYVSTITSLARTIEARDPYTGGHTERVGRLARRIAEELGFGEADLRAIEVGAVMHDIGKIGIPDRILLKEGPLTPEERREMERHPEISSYILGELEMPTLVKQMARNHHERYDGTGYPDGLVGEEIPLPARILTVADTLDAITSDRPYRRARSVAEGLAILEAESGSQFCPQVVVALKAVLEREPNVMAEDAPPVAAP